ncbi:MAG: hypothetical protein MN733_11545 [Nitrososphaera sp.]|nr:hypothetical protein [Nitrososphaera sp.]
MIPVTLDGFECFARKEGIHYSVDSNYVSQMVNLTALAPDIVAAILDESLPPGVKLFNIAVDPPGAVGEAAGLHLDPTLAKVTGIIRSISGRAQLPLNVTYAMI